MTHQPLTTRYMSNGNDHGAWIVEDHSFDMGDCYAVIIGEIGFGAPEQVDGAYGIETLVEATAKAQVLLNHWDRVD